MFDWFPELFRWMFSDQERWFQIIPALTFFFNTIAGFVIMVGSITQYSYERCEDDMRLNAKIFVLGFLGTLSLFGIIIYAVGYGLCWISKHLINGFRLGGIFKFFRLAFTSGKVKIPKAKVVKE